MKKRVRLSRRLGLELGAGASALTVIVAMAAIMFSASVPQVNQFAPGTVPTASLTANSSNTVTCTAVTEGLLPGDSSTGFVGGSGTNALAPCENAVVYSNTNQGAYIGLDVSVTTTSATANSNALISSPSTGGTGLQIQASVPGSPVTINNGSFPEIDETGCTGAYMAPQFCTGDSGIQVVQTIAGNSAATEVDAMLNYWLNDVANPGSFAGSTATVTVTVYAANCRNNGNGSDDGNNADCSAPAPVSWS